MTSLASPSCSKRATKCLLVSPLSLHINLSNSFTSSFPTSGSSTQSNKDGIVELDILMLGVMTFEVTLGIPLAMRHLAVRFSLGASKWDTRVEVEDAIATFYLHYLNL